MRLHLPQMLTRSIRPSLLIVPLVALLGSSLDAEGPNKVPGNSRQEQNTAFFEKKIRPVLVKYCYACHSAKARLAKKLRGGLSLDHRDGLIKGGDSGAAVVPGKPQDSLLLEAIEYESLEMPPKGKLPRSVIDDFRKWIAQGAHDPRRGQATTGSTINIQAGRKHWAYQPLNRPPLPRPHRPEHGSASSAVDAFLLKRLDSAQLQQVGLADRATLLRRLHFDLIGLPPTPDQIEHFVNDDSPLAYERQVEQLMASPHFGERWGRHWLDVVRYAESITLRGFLFPEAWRYRDYVVETFNSDRPFDQFVHEQLAGDLLMAKSLEQQQRHIIATTFLALGNNNLEDQDKDKLRMDVVDEQLETISRGFLAQTIGCARCHDHKFDPIPTRDYYALAGILRNTKTLNHANVSKWIELPLPMDPGQAAKIKNYSTAVAKIRTRIDTLKAAGTGKGLAPLPLAQLDGIVVDDLEAVTTGQWMKSQSSKSYIGTGYQHDLGKQKGSKTAHFRPKLPRDGVYEVRFAYTPGSNRSAAVPVTVTGADGSKTFTINQKQTPAIRGRFVSLGRHRFLANETPEVVVTNTGTQDVVIIDAVQFLPEALANQAPTTTKTPPANNPDRLKQLALLKKQLETLKQQAPPQPKSMSVQEEQAIQDTRVHVRGDVHNLGDEVPRGFLQVIAIEQPPEFSNTQSGRRQLADWITCRDNPLTARVLANRIWHWLFGSGLVRTTDNFGTTGELPSHPELLDYLATRLVEQNWSPKSLLRELVLSRTYRLSSRSNPIQHDRDPDNRLLWRMNRKRLDAESLLDSMLAISGRLQRHLGGSQIRPSTKNDYNYSQDSTRRALYWPVLRNSLPQLFKVFDFANPSMVTGRREHSATTPQALFLMNNPWVAQQADHAARRLLASENLDDQQRIRLAVASTLGRPPTYSESKTMLVFIRSRNDDKTDIGDGDTADKNARRQQQWSQLIQTLFASIDFRYLR